MAMTPEKKLMNEIRIEAGKRGCAVIRLNVGKFQLITGEWFDTGIPKGFPDMMILTPNGRTIFVETKIHPRKPSKDQIHMIEFLKSKNQEVYVIYNVKELLKII